MQCLSAQPSLLKGHVSYDNFLKLGSGAQIGPSLQKLMCINLLHFIFRYTSLVLYRLTNFPLSSSLLLVESEALIEGKTLAQST